MKGGGGTSRLPYSSPQVVLCYNDRNTGQPTHNSTTCLYSIKDHILLIVFDSMYLLGGIPCMLRVPIPVRPAASLTLHEHGANSLRFSHLRPLIYINIGGTMEKNTAFLKVI